jgi:hypothetical protein
MMCALRQSDLNNTIYQLEQRVVGASNSLAKLRNNGGPPSNIERV